MAEATNCPNCGAAMDLVESRRYLRCQHCGTYQFHQTTEAEGIRIIGNLADAPGCPVCSVPMAHAVIDDDYPIDFCTKCRGLLLPRETFAHVTNTRRAWATTPPAEPVPFDPNDLARKLHCPKCQQKFETYPNYGPGNVVIDNCTVCDVIWLDYGELKRIVDAPGRDRAARHVPRIDEEYVRKGAPHVEPEEDLRAARMANDPLSFLLHTLFDRD